MDKLLKKIIQLFGALAVAGILVGAFLAFVLGYAVLRLIQVGDKVIFMGRVLLTNVGVCSLLGFVVPFISGILIKKKADPASITGLLVYFAPLLTGVVVLLNSFIIGFLIIGLLGGPYSALIFSPHIWLEITALVLSASLGLYLAEEAYQRGLRIAIRKNRRLMLSCFGIVLLLLLIAAIVETLIVA